jgi:hypothetical protein
MIAIYLWMELMGHLEMVVASMSMCSTQVSAQHIKILAGVQFQLSTPAQDGQPYAIQVTDSALVMVTVMARIVPVLSVAQNPELQRNRYCMQSRF